jgi:hypothetical protein
MTFACIPAVALVVKQAWGQDVPLISGGVAFFTNTTGGTTSYQPQIQPLLAAPIGKSFLIESRALILEEIFPNGSGGYGHVHFADFIYLQGDYIATPHLTVVGGSFLLPFNTYNERLSENWIGDLQDGPLIAGMGTFSNGTGLGGMVSGSAYSSNKVSVAYNAWFSSRSNNYYFTAQRTSGGRVSVYFPESRVEIGASYDRRLQNPNENFFGTHVWWEPPDTGLRVRSEYSLGQHAQGYWIQADYRTHAFGGPESVIGRFQPVFRMQQTFRRDNLASDSVPGVNTQRADFGLNYNFPHDVRILTSYSRQFAQTGDVNIWETGLVYRFLFPMWKGKAD